MNKVMVFGTFDIYHPGHLYFLKQAKKHGDLLFVVVSRDDTVKKLKGQSPLHNEKERLKKVQSLPFVDCAVLGSTKDKFSILAKIKPDIICLGYDQYYFTENLEEELKKRGIKTKIIRLKAYKEHLYKSSKLRKTISEKLRH